MTDIFVFGSNLKGRHGKGSAKEALDKHGAIYGVGEGLQGNSYGIPTKGHKLEVLSLDTVRWYVARFIRHARANPGDTFNVVEIGCGLAGYKASDIAPMFADAPNNVMLPQSFVAEYGK